MTQRTSPLVATVFGLCTMFAFASTASAQTIEDLTKQGRLGLGGSGTFNYTSSSNEVVIDNTVTNTTANNSNMFLLVTPEFGYFMSDRLQLAINVGFLLRRLQRDAENSNTERDWLFSGGVKYHIPFTDRFSFIPGIGAGFYLGSSSRPLQVTIDGKDSIADEDTSTWGFDFNTNLSFGYLVGKRTELQAGLQMHYLYGFENISTVSESLSISTFNVGLNLGIFYYF